MRLVADTNIVLSGLLWIGNPGRILEAAANRSITLFTSPALVMELRSTLGYDRLAARVARSGLSIDELLARYVSVALVMEPTVVPRICRDPDDDHVLACALAAHADLIVTGDNDLLVIGSYEGIPIVTAAEAVRRLEAASK